MFAFSLSELVITFILMLDAQRSKQFQSFIAYLDNYIILSQLNQLFVMYNYHLIFPTISFKKHQLYTPHTLAIAEKNGIM